MHEIEPRPIYVLCGGPGNEHDVSLVSGKTVYDTLRGFYEDVQKVEVLKDGNWKFRDRERNPKQGAVEILRRNGVVFPIIHGTYGEDGELQELLEEFNIPFFGSASHAMRLTINKAMTGDFLEKKDIRVPKSILITNHEGIREDMFVFPCIVKPVDEWSSVSLYKVSDYKSLQDILTIELGARKEVLVQEFVIGREFTCGVVELEGELKALLPTEVILTKGELFDYSAKYNVGGCEEITPPNIDDATIKRIQETALAVHKVCDAEDISRTDMILNQEGELVVLEINTIPGMTPTSFVPAELVASWYTLEEFLKGMTQKYTHS